MTAISLHFNNRKAIVLTKCETMAFIKYIGVKTMNKEWSELNKTMQNQLKKSETYCNGIETLFELRKQLMQTLDLFRCELSRDDFNAIPFINIDGYHSSAGVRQRLPRGYIRLRPGGSHEGADSRI